MKRNFCIVFCFLLVIFLSLQCSKKDAENNKTIIVAKVNGTAITLEEFQKKYEHIKELYDPVSLKISSSLELLKRSLLNQMITSIILKKEAWKANCTVSDEELNMHIQEIKKDYSDEQFRQMIIKGRLSFTDWKEEQREHLIIKKLTAKVVESVEVIPEKDLRDYYKKNISDYKKQEQVRIAQIVVDSNSLAHELLKKIKRGANFSEMAKLHSKSPDAEKGGDLGYFEKGGKIPEFDLGFELSVGRVSKVIKSAYGYHIIKVLGKKPAMTLPFSRVREEIREKILKLRQSETYKKWLEKKVSEADIFRNREVLSLIR